MILTESTSLTEFVVDIAGSATDDRALLGGKGSGLVQMTRLGIPVPPGFVLTTKCGQYFRDHGSLPLEVTAGIEAHLSLIHI